MREVAADRAGVGDHRDRGEAKAQKCAQVRHEHLVVGMARRLGVQIERIGVFHQEFARAHDAEARAHFVAKLPLNMVQIERQVFVRAHVGAEDFGDHLLIGRAIEHVALVAILDAQHLLAVVVVAAGFAPKLRRLDRRHQQFDRAGAILLLANDLADLGENAEAQRQPGVNAGRLLADHAGAQHQAMRDDFRFLGRLAQDRQKIAGKTHQKLSGDRRCKADRLAVAQSGASRRLMT